MRIITKPDGVVRRSFKVRTLLSFLGLLAAGLWPAAMAQAQAQVIADIPDQPPLVQLDYPNVAEGTKPLGLTRELLSLLAVNNTGAPVVVELEARSISGGDDETRLMRFFWDFHTGDGPTFDAVLFNEMWSSSPTHLPLHPLCRKWAPTRPWRMPWKPSIRATGRTSSSTGPT
ncbi:MAG TPA: hypothetical protein VE422_25130 [Terriglobia bacterium]|nr:hypothetical protein [Terriglobia bacterium]